MSMRYQRDERTDEIVQKYERILEAIHQAPASFAVYDDEDVLIAWNPAYQDLHPDAFKGRAPDDARRLSYADVARRNAVNFYADERLGRYVARRVREPHLVRSRADIRTDAETAPRQIFTFVAPANAAAGFDKDGKELRLAKRAIPDFGQLIASTQTGAVLVDKTLTVRMINQAYYDLWNLKPDGVQEGLHIRALMEASFSNGTHSLKVENREDYIASQCSEIADGRAEPRELVLKNGQTLIYSVRPLAGGMRLITYLDPVSRAVPGATVKPDAAVFVTADVAENVFGPMARMWRDLPEKYAGHVNRLRTIVTNLIGHPAVFSNDDPDMNSATDTPALTDTKPAKTIPASGTPTENELEDRSEHVDILVCEDNDANQILFTQVLRATGYTFKIANNGREGVELFKSCKPRLILMDIVMPEMGGLEATVAIRDLEADTLERTPIVAVTAHVIHGDREMCFDAGMDDFLTKPVSPSKLEEKINKWLADEADALSA